MNWQSLIADLRARNFRQVDIAAICNCKQSTISDLATGETEQPSFALGQSLIALHKSRRKGPSAAKSRAEA
jgi:predicted XRE-type DNA-binding protein